MKHSLDASRWQRLYALFDQAVGLGRALQAELLRNVEREDADLARELAALLGADSRHAGHTGRHRALVLQGSMAALAHRARTARPDAADPATVSPGILSADQS